MTQQKIDEFQFPANNILSGLGGVGGEKILLKFFQFLL